MDKKTILMRRFRALAVTTLFLSVMTFSALAADVSVNFYADGSSGHIIFDSSGVGNNPLADDSYLQLIKSPDAVINPPGGPNGEMGGNDTLVTTEVVRIGDGTGDVAGTFQKFIERVPQNYYVYVRAWDSSDPSTATHFGNSNMVRVTLTDPPSAVDFNVNSFATTQLKLAPIITAVTPSGVDHDDAVITVSVNPNTPVASGTSYLSGYAYLIEWKKSFQSWPQNTQYQNSPSLALEGLDTGMEYDVRAKAANYFGESGYTDTSFSTTAYPGPISGTTSDLRITLLGGGDVQLDWIGQDTNTCEVYTSTSATGEFTYLDEVGGGGPAFTYTHNSPGEERYYRVKAINGLYAPEIVGKYTFTLKKTATTGINSISMPLDTTISGNSPNILTALDVAGDCPNFEFIGGWNKDTQQEFGYLSSGDGDPTFLIKPGIGYQISVSTDNTKWSIVGQK